jgi:hypothetical protein
MLKALLAIVRVLLSSTIVELAGGALVVTGVFLAWGVAAGLVGAGVALVLKAYELDGGS